MGEQTTIEWCQNTDGTRGHTFNPWIGCARVSPGCLHCYAEARDQRFGDGLWGKTAPRRVTSDANWRKPLAWDRAAAAAGRRDRVFCASLADVFEDRPDLVEPRQRLWQLIAATPNLDWLLLTKRPENIYGRVPWGINPWPNVWLGTTVEDQQRADERVPVLLDVPAAVRFLSCEPLLGPVDLSPWLDPPCDDDPDGLHHCGCGHDAPDDLHWVIAGGESGGRHARPMHPAWARGLRDQCQAAGVPFLFKQWGSWSPGMLSRYSTYWPEDGTHVSYRGTSGKSGGRELDGRTWDEMPAAVSP